MRTTLFWLVFFSAVDAGAETGAGVAPPHLRLLSPLGRSRPAADASREVGSIGCSMA
jgi:hypothetical protein